MGRDDSLQTKTNNFFVWFKVIMDPLQNEL